MTRHGVAFLAAAALVLNAPSVRAQDVMPYCEDGFDFAVGPTVVPASGWDRLAGKAVLIACNTGHGHTRAAEAEPTAEMDPCVVREDDSGFPFSYAMHVETTYLLASGDVRIPDATTVKASAGLSLSLAKPPKRAPCDLTPPEILQWDGGGFNLGFVDVGASVGYEASADRTEQNVTFGPELRYAITTTGWGRLLPSLVARYELVDPTRSEVRDALGIPRASDRHGRLSVRAYWNTPLAFISESVRLQADAYLFRARGLEADLVAAGWEDGAYGGGTLSYVPHLKLLGRIELTSVYARYSVGQLPTDSKERHAFSSGVAIGVRE